MHEPKTAAARLDLRTQSLFFSQKKEVRSLGENNKAHRHLHQLYIMFCYKLICNRAQRRHLRTVLRRLVVRMQKLGGTVNFIISDKYDRVEMAHA
jgi:hypothetical protein